MPSQNTAGNNKVRKIWAWNLLKIKNTEPEQGLLVLIK